ncbi:uncharacterized protein JCM15063_002517 [Sporobolomyces koalae]|uniref:uncharacterized protein n=1 Tax=Sporobolomyces koalae TaxID=500713 RepID=UPI003170C781
MRASLAAAILVLSSLSAFAVARPDPSATKKAPKVKAAAEDNPDDPTACGFYRCTVTWNIGEEVAVNWLGPPGGNVSVSLQSNIGGPTYPIVDSIAGTSQEGYCDAGYGVGVLAAGHVCGRVQFVVPSGWQKMDNYTIVVQSLQDPNEAGYTDMITIAAQNASNSNSNIPSGTAVSLETIPAPTSTNYGASTYPSISVPAPTAITGSPSSSAAASSASLTSSTRRDRSSSITSQTSALSSAGASAASAAASGSPSKAPSSSAPERLAFQAGTALFAVALVSMVYL